MKKTLLLAAVMALGVNAGVYAANPFSDVPAGHWAYDAVNKLAAEGDHLVNGPIVMVGEGAGLGEAGPVFLVGRDDPFVDHVDVAFAFLDEGEAEFEAFGEHDHLVDDRGRDRVAVDDGVADDGIAPVHRHQAVWLDIIQNPRFPYEVEVPAGAKENLYPVFLHLFDGLDGRRGDAVGFVREKGAVDVGEDDFYAVFAVIDCHFRFFIILECRFHIKAFGWAQT